MKSFSALLLTLSGLLLACNNNEDPEELIEELPEAHVIAVVVHVIHSGESIGEGSNLSEERILAQIKSLNNDFNSSISDSSGAIQFKLAAYDPGGNSTNGITRINQEDIDIETNSTQVPFDWLPQYNYWNPEDYINIWLMPLQQNIFLGMSTKPTCDLPGLEEEVATVGEGILINTYHFGTSDIEGGSNQGKTLTHEMGHFLGLEHLWGKVENAECFKYDDFVDDTPPVTKRSQGCKHSQLSCSDKPALTNNFMDYIPDTCMTSFTPGQISRMRYALEHSENRKSLISSNLNNQQ